MKTALYIIIAAWIAVMIWPGLSEAWQEGVRAIVNDIQDAEEIISNIMGVQ